MPYIRGVATTFEDLISQVITWATDTTIHGANAWQLMRNEPWPRGAILKAHGWDQGEHFYVGLMPKLIEKGQTYKKWFLQKEILASKFVWAKDGLNITNYLSFTANELNLAINYETSSEGISFADNPEIFMKSARVMFGGVFKQYAEALDWHEQAGGIVQEGIKVKPIAYNRNRNTYLFTPPLYPGVGYPAMGMDYEGAIDGYFTYWVVKDAHRMTIVIKNRDCWDVLHLGFMEPYAVKTQYAFPAVAIGGTSGATSTGERFTFPNEIDPRPITGVMFDYTPRNWSLIHGIPPFAGVPYDDQHTISPVNVMLPDGRWQAFANWVQDIKVKIEYGASGRISSMFFLRDKPIRTDKLKHYIRPGCSDLEGTKHVYGPIIDTSLTYQLEPIEFVDATSNSNFFGKLWGIYWPSTRIAQYGEVIINNKKHLVLPNSWEGRRWHIPDGFTGIDNPDQLLAQDLEIEAMSQQMNCVIRLED